MRVASLVIMAAFATLVIAEVNEFKPVKTERDEHPVVAASTLFPINGWGVTDWVMGLVLGSYANL